MHHRTPWRILALVAAAALVFSGLAAVAGPASADTVRVPGYYPSGPQTNVPVSTVTDGGWTQCHLSKYADSLGPALPSVLPACNQKYLMLAGRATGSGTLGLLAAAPRTDVLFATGINSETTHPANGSEWYFDNNYSWGFAKGGDAVDKHQCDDLGGPLRLCWHTLQNSFGGGYRIGDTKALNFSTDYERVIYQSDGRLPQTISFTSTAPTNARIGDTYDAAATGGASGKPVTLSSGTPDVCTVADGKVSLLVAGDCTVLADQAGDDDHNPAPQASQTFAVAKRAQTVSFTSDPPAKAYVDGTYYPTTSGGASGNQVTLSSGTPDVCTVQGGAVSFVTDGECTLLADQDGNATYDAAAQATQTFAVSPKRLQTITFTTTAPTSAYVGQGYDVAATSDSGLPVTLASSTPDVCTVDGGRVVTSGAGACTITADQAGDAENTSATQATQSVTVKKIPASVSVTTPTTTVSGQDVTVSAQVSVPEDAPGGIPAGSVQFSVDGTDVGDPVAVDESGSAVSPSFARTVGDHAITATFTPGDATTYAGEAGLGTLGVAKATTTTKVSVTATQLRAEVAAVAPGSADPNGSVDFYVAGEKVGSADVSDGVAVLDHVVEPGASRAVAAEYAGDYETSGSTDSLTRNDPSITAKVSSRSPRSAAGWYSAPVRIDYACTPNGAKLVGDCPAADTTSTDGAQQSFTRTVTAADGGISSVTTTVDVDQAAPTVRVGGIAAGKRYFAKAPQAQCVGSDALSGIASCVVTSAKGRNGAETVTATATDKAGNTATARTSYLVVRYAVAGADYVDGAYVIRKGRTIQVQAQTSGRPTYRIASSTPARLAKAATRTMVRTGKDTWAYGAVVTMPRTKSGIWYLGIQEGRSITPIKVRMIG